MPVYTLTLADDNHNRGYSSHFRSPPRCVLSTMCETGDDMVNAFGNMLVCTILRTWALTVSVIVRAWSEEPRVRHTFSDVFC